MKKLIIIKIGGAAIQQLTTAFFHQLQTWHLQGHRILIVHGGGPMISQLMTRLQLPVKKMNGLRVTDDQTLALTKLVLLGEAQPALLTQLAQHHLPVIGLNAADNQLLVGDYVNQAQLGAVGKVTTVNQSYLQASLAHHIGVLAPLALTATGHWLNVNADVAATALAQQLQAEKLVLLTDVPGIIHHGNVLTTLSPHQAQTLTQQAVITAGMRPKVQAAIQAIQAGVAQAVITNAIDQPGTAIIQEAAI
ncbi:acetylglutamate kinase [Lactobacillus plantarum JDM1] [Lactiplantibacillus mudanjiangensis]|uniref:acetylglutamate kinase n=1 Tax=Lactiplantibacillus mudanjiangensis TaxID=1296538 RepID=UPI001014BA7A|nr:acetylglutamate kinase [Lactiplantibacillus mudanjiangensis]VDG31554.1 acetylglutamate kinase [Lactobacillus plantarum JDM1] [Lactiplantibacillus mudanjiangensis]